MQKNFLQRENFGWDIAWALSKYDRNISVRAYVPDGFHVHSEGNPDDVLLDSVLMYVEESSEQFHEDALRAFFKLQVCFSEFQKFYATQRTLCDS